MKKKQRKITSKTKKTEPVPGKTCQPKVQRHSFPYDFPGQTQSFIPL